MGGYDAGTDLLVSWSVNTCGITDKGGAPGFVERDPAIDTVSQCSAGDTGEILEATGCVPVQPTPGVLERLGQVPMVKRGDRFDPLGAQGIDEPAVVVQARLVDGGLAVRLHPRPGDRETVRGDPEIREEIHVLLEAVV